MWRKIYDHVAEWDEQEKKETLVKNDVGLYENKSRANYTVFIYKIYFKYLITSNEFSLII